MQREMLVTVRTGRDREDIGKALALSIRHHRADRVWCLATLKSRAETVPIVQREIGGAGPPLETVLVEDENDAEHCQRQFQRVIAGRISDGLRPEDVVVDYTSGTKAMSAGLFAAAVAMRVETISYIAGRRDEGGRVIPGTERFTSFAPRVLYAQRDLDQAIWLFDRYRFEEAVQLAACAGTCGDPDIAGRAQLLGRLASAYGAWDRFDHAEAFRQMDALDKDPRLSPWRLEEKVRAAKQFLYRAKGRPFCPEKLADLAANAGRRFEEGKYDDAVARCYRAFEFFAQLRQSDHDLNPADLRWDTVALKLPSGFHEVWRSRVDGKGRLPLGLRHDYELLRDLGDRMGAAFCADYEQKGSRLRKRLEQRNHSILAHGADPIGREAAQELLELLNRFVREDIGRWVALIEAATFARLSSHDIASRG